ncbi:MAG: threonine/serine exporter family protein [Lactobacillales bacterium]|jgi:uncharacterized membrane protein YjjB (DUF3815 family)|nr:threonine/serine exporter family protein [Lactobacillales bacterium]
MEIDLLKALQEVFFSFLATMAFAVVCNVSRYALIYCGATGAAGWLVYWIIIQLGGNMPIATLAGSLVVAFFSSFFAKKAKMPVTVFNIPGIVPLVPGALAYEAVRSLAQGDYYPAIQIGTDVVMSAGAIALGLILAEVFNHNIRNFANANKAKRLNK